MQDVLELDKEVHVEPQGDEEQHRADDGDDGDAATCGAEVFDEFLLLQGVAVGGLADALQLIFDALEGGALVGDLATELAVTVVNLSETAFQGIQINRGRRWVMRLVGNNH